MRKILFLFFLLIPTAWASEYLEAMNFDVVDSKLQELRARYGAREVLLVLDIDNTLLRANQGLGSDQWFEWQNEAVKNRSTEASFKSFEDLLWGQAAYFQLSRMSLTEDRLPKLASSILRQGHPTFLLTSRSPDLRNVTERELKRNGLWFANSFPLRGIPHDVVEPPFKNPVSFMNGIFMTSGHHKGEALKYLLRKSGQRFRAIVFVDDHERHTKRVFETFNGAGDVEIFTYRYGHEDARVKAFKNAGKSSYVSQTREFQGLINRLFK